MSSENINLILAAFSIIIGILVLFIEPVPRWVRYVGATIAVSAALIVVIRVTGVFDEDRRLYDNFDSITENQSFDPTRWEVFEHGNCNVHQDTGHAVFNVTDDTELSLCGIVVAGGNVPLEEIGSIEASFRALLGAEGNSSMSSIEISTGDLTEGLLWVAQCGISQTPNDEYAELFFWVSSEVPNTDAAADASGGVKISSENFYSDSQWYRMRLAVDPQTAEITCYADDELVGRFTPRNYEELRTAGFSRHIIGYWVEGSTGIYYADDILLEKKYNSKRSIPGNHP